MNAYQVRMMIDDAMERAAKFNNTNKWTDYEAEYSEPIIEFVFDKSTKKMYLEIVVQEQEQA